MKQQIMYFDSQTNEIRKEKIKYVHEDKIETKHELYELSDAVKWTDYNTGDVFYLIHTDLPAKVEAQNLKRLRRSVAINNLFTYDVKKPMDIFRLMPYAVIFGMILFN